MASVCASVNQVSKIVSAEQRLTLYIIACRGYAILANESTMITNQNSRSPNLLKLDERLMHMGGLLIAVRP